MSAASWVAEINNIEREEKHHREALKRLRERKAQPKQALYRFMARHGYNEYGGITLKRVAPAAARRPRKPAREKRSDAVRLFREIGVPDPVGFYDEFMRTQKA